MGKHYYIQKKVHILGERELNGAHFHLMNATVNAFILASVNGALHSFIFRS